MLKLLKGFFLTGCCVLVWGLLQNVKRDPWICISLVFPAAPHVACFDLSSFWCCCFLSVPFPFSGAAWVLTSLSPLPFSSSVWILVTFKWLQVLTLGELLMCMKDGRFSFFILPVYWVRNLKFYPKAKRPQGSKSEMKELLWSFGRFFCPSKCIPGLGSDWNPIWAPHSQGLSSLLPHLQWDFWLKRE